ncbi:MAG: hypothetical protein HYR85_03065 [Planctomycetes bacterium]|nr:hypothetical protein [Planctomycetota bacterium]
MLTEWVRVFGRLHPILLHLPIGLLGGLAALEFVTLFRKGIVSRGAISIVAWLTAASAVMSATTGWVLSDEAGYGGDTLETHEWLGISVAAASVVVALLHALSRGGTRVPVLAAYRVALVATMGGLLPAGHFGSTLVRGEGFLTEPLRAEDAVSATATSTYARLIAPIFSARCMTCHSESKKKGGLTLENEAGIIGGGVDGAVIVEGKPEQSEMIKRLRLPESDRDHMPPKGKGQPTAEEIGRIEAWIAAGAPFEGNVPGLEPEPPIAPPDPNAVARLEQALVHVEAQAQGSNLLWIDFAGAAAKTTDATAAELLTPLLDQVEQLSLGHCGITDATMALVAQMRHLRRLDVRATGVTDAGIAALAHHEKLEELILVQTKLTDAAVSHLAALPALKRVYLWHSGVSEDVALKLHEQRASLEIEAGDVRDAAVVETEKDLQLTNTAPVAGAPPGAEVLAPVNTTCPVTDRAVDPAYRIVYKGRVVGFCCPKCPPQFWADPEKYASKLP